MSIKGKQFSGTVPLWVAKKLLDIENKENQKRLNQGNTKRFSKSDLVAKALTLFAQNYEG